MVLEVGALRLEVLATEVQGVAHYESEVLYWEAVEELPQVLMASMALIHCQYDHAVGAQAAGAVSSWEPLLPRPAPCV